MTNADVIRSFSDEQIAEWYFRFIDDEYPAYWGNKHGFLLWLKQEAPKTNSVFEDWCEYKGSCKNSQMVL